jgi:rod shape-determining protein MreC
VHGVLKGLGTSSARVDFVPTGQKVENGEMFFTSGEDRVFPKGLPVGKVTSVRDGTNFQDITVEPSGTESAPEEVLVIIDPVHQAIPEALPGDTPVFLGPDVNSDDQTQQTGGAGLTTADKLRDQYKKIGDAQKHVFGVGGPGTPPPNFNLKVPGVNAPADSAAQVPASSKPSSPASPSSPSSPAPSASPSHPEDVKKEDAKKTEAGAKTPAPAAPASAAPAPAKPAATQSPAPQKAPQP